MGRKMVATAASRRLTTARCLLASEACSTSRALHRSSIAPMFASPEQSLPRSAVRSRQRTATDDQEARPPPWRSGL